MRPTTQRPFGCGLAVLAAGLLAAPATAQEAPSAASMKPYTETIPGTDLKFDMVPIPGGTLAMGSPAGEAGRQDDEGPVHEVTVSPFWMSKHEITWEIYDQFAFSLDIRKREREAIDLAKLSAADKLAEAVTRPTPPYADMTFGYGHDKQPAICMTHHAAIEFGRWVAAKTGKPYRLPTEAEWEFACRAGTKTRFFFGDDEAKLDEYAWYVNNAEKPMPVGQKKPSPWGLYDIHGNVAEWVVDHYDPAYYKQFEGKAADRPVLLPDAKEYPYVARGGSYDDDPEALRSAARKGSDKEWSMQDPQRPQSIWWHTEAHWVGIRLVRPLREQDNLKDLKSPIVKRGATK